MEAIQQNTDYENVNQELAQEKIETTEKPLSAELLDAYDVYKENLAAIPAKLTSLTLEQLAEIDPQLRYNRMLCLRINEHIFGNLNKFSINKEIRSWKSMINYQDFSKD